MAELMTPGLMISKTSLYLCRKYDICWLSPHTAAIDIKLQLEKYQTLEHKISVFIMWLQLLDNVTKIYVPVIEDDKQECHCVSYVHYLRVLYAYLTYFLHSPGMTESN